MEIPIEYPTKKFQQYLEFENNSRILFTGKFGTGKTYFLKKYFKENATFSTIHLFPTNYQVSQNEDIFELLKFDILLKLIERGWIKSDEEVNNKLAIQSYFLTAGDDLLSPLLKSIPKIGKVYTAFENIIKFFENYKKYVDELNNNTIKLLKIFGDNISEKKGSIYEQDLISNIITESLEEHKADSSTVLIIDDIDRIDPEHVFRILNVFSAHFDLESETENKFNFDKIIVVCDLLNLEKIFYSKYGLETDFHGYIDKFYSNSCFLFSNKKSIEESIKVLIRDYIKRNECNNHFQGILTYYVQPLLVDFVHTEVITLRDILHIQNSKFQDSDYFTFYLGKLDRAENWEFSIIFMFDFLEFVFGRNKTKLKAALKNCSKIIQKSKLGNDIIDDVIMFSFPTNLVNIREENDLTDRELNRRFKFKIIEKHSVLIRTNYIADKVEVFNERNETVKLSTQEIYKLLCKAYENINNIKKEEIR